VVLVVGEYPPFRTAARPGVLDERVEQGPSAARASMRRCDIDRVEEHRALPSRMDELMSVDTTHGLAFVLSDEVDGFGSRKQGRDSLGRDGIA